ncbi:MAG: S-layer homology domain-containing protein, partial [Clostridia bacterium]|nr:S-layer homology domain-containing protein [Clostridia bacterium]
MLYANRAYLNIDFSEYDSLKNKSNITRQLAGVMFKDCKELTEKFDELVEYEKQNESNVSGVGSSGGRGGSSVISIPPSAVVPDTETNTNEDKFFKDIETVEWAKESILALAKAGIIDGKTKDMFFPNDFITREEFVKILVNALDIYDSDAECEFADVSADKWFYKYVATAASK